MSDFQTAPGFEDVWRPPVRTRAVWPAALLSPIAAGDATRARLARIVDRAPEALVKVTGRTRDAKHLLAHLRYISRNGQLDLEGPDNQRVVGCGDVIDLAADWAAAAEADNARRSNSPISHSIVLSMPAGTNEVAIRDAARAFAAAAFRDRHDYVLVLHTDTPRPHVHLSVCSRGRNGERLNPKKADLEQWRQIFAQALRDRGVVAEATPRRARGVTHKAERTVLRKMDERYVAGRGEMAKVRRSAYYEASRAALSGDTQRRPWEVRAVARQAAVRGAYLAEARVLARSPRPDDRALGAKLETFVRQMPPSDTKRLALARELRAGAALETAPAKPKERMR